MVASANTGFDILETHHDEERAVWEMMTPMAWHDSVARKDSIFYETYVATRHQLEETIINGQFDVILEVGCGTGDVIGKMETSIPRYGIDINADFLQFCKDTYTSEKCNFFIVDALKLTDWWKSEGLDEKFKKPLVTCVNNTLNIMPDHLRGGVIDQMLSIAGPEGLCMATYWNGEFFSHAVLNYYKKNPQLCGEFEISKHVDWDRRILVTPSNYSTEWHTPKEVELLMRTNDIDVSINKYQGKYDGQCCINCDQLAIFVWFDGTTTSNAKGYYDSEDAQKFYYHIWGGNSIHLGRFDLLTDEDLSSSSALEQVSKASVMHEVSLLNVIRSKMSTDCMAEDSVGLRVVDMGSGYGSFLRHMWSEGMVWSAVGVDISNQMTYKSNLMNAQFNQECVKDITMLNGSFLEIDVLDESADLVVSIDSLLHVGPQRQCRAVQEAARILRPGGYMIFSDIMQQEDVDPNEMKPIYDRINLSKMGTVSNYQSALEANGFTNINVELHSENIATHYRKIREVLEKEGSRFEISDASISKMTQGLMIWENLGPKNIVWGIISARKTHKCN